jgi:hypothetical protein
MLGRRNLESAHGVCTRGEVKGTLALMDHLARARFVQGLASERI